MVSDVEEAGEFELAGRDNCSDATRLAALFSPPNSPFKLTLEADGAGEDFTDSVGVLVGVLGRSGFPGDDGGDEDWPSCRVESFSGVTTGAGFPLASSR